MSERREVQERKGYCRYSDPGRRGGEESGKEWHIEIELP